MVGVEKLELFWPLKVTALEGTGDDLVVKASTIVRGEDDWAGADELEKLGQGDRDRECLGGIVLDVLCVFLGRVLAGTHRDEALEKVFACPLLLAGVDETVKVSIRPQDIDGADLKDKALVPCVASLHDAGL